MRFFLRNLAQGTGAFLSGILAAGLGVYIMGYLAAIAIPMAFFDFFAPNKTLPLFLIHTLSILLSFCACAVLATWLNTRLNSFSRTMNALLVVAGWPVGLTIVWVYFPGPPVTLQSAFSYLFMPELFHTYALLLLSIIITAHSIKKPLSPV